MSEKKIYYYRIYDDHEEMDFIKSSVNYEKIRELLKDFEKVHNEYYNSEFVNFLREVDPNAELIEVTNIYY